MNIQPAATKSGKAGAIARLLILGLCLAIGIIAATCDIFSPNGRNFFEKIALFIGDIGAMCVTSLCFWIGIKWCAFLGSRTIRWAGAFWETFIPLNLFTLAAKVCIWLAIIILPFTFGLGVPLAPVMGVIFFMMNMSDNLLVMLLITAAALAVMALLALYDLKKLNLSPEKITQAIRSVQK